MRSTRTTIRRGALAAAASLVLLLVGSGAAWEERTPEDDDCEKDLGYIFDVCHESPIAECMTVREDYRDACEAACVRGWCPKQVECTGLDPMWCAPCEDMQGAQFWRDFAKATSQCWQAEFNEFRDAHPNEPLWLPDYEHLHACRDAKVLKACPELKGTNWQAVIKDVVPVDWGD